MNVTVDVRTTELSNWARYAQAELIPRATYLAINRTAEEFQTAQRAHMADVFKIRRPQFLKMSVKIKPFARKDSPSATVKIDSPGGRSDIFAKFEDMTIKGPFRGTSIAVPTRHVPRTGAGIIKKAWRPKSLLGGGKAGSSDRLLPGGGVLVGNETIQGKKHVFLIRRSSGKGTIFMRINPRNAAKYKAAGEDGVRRNLRDASLVPLYQLVPSVPIEPELNFVETAQRTIQDRWAVNFTGFFDSTVRQVR